MARKRSSTSTVHSGNAIDTRAYKDAAKALRQGAKHLNREFRKELRDAGEIMGGTARMIAAEHSESIPPTVKVRVAGAQVAVVAGGAQAPVAGLFELGNKGKKSAALTGRGYFKHPVFGDKNNWVYQPMHRFLQPAADMVLPEAQRKIEEVLSDVAEIVATEYYEENY